MGRPLIAGLTEQSLRPVPDRIRSSEAVRILLEECSPHLKPLTPWTRRMAEHRSGGPL